MSEEIKEIFYKLPPTLVGGLVGKTELALAKFQKIYQSALML